jgi:hypothetical protein
VADNVAITAGAGTSIATDEVGTDHYQRVKLADGTADSSTAIAAGNGTAANALRVSVASDSTGQVKVTDGTNTIAIATAGADGESNTANRLKAEVYNDIFNGSTWDRQRGDVGGIWVRPFPGRGALAQGAASSTSSSSTQVIAGTASNYLYITSIIVHNSSTTDTYVTLQDGSGGTTIAIVPAAAKGGAVITPATPIMVPTSGNGLYFAQPGSLSTVYVFAAGYKLTI